jgi:hypothetical protein
MVVVKKRGVAMKCLAVVMFLLAMVGCTTTSDVMRLDDNTRAPTLLSDVAVLVEEPSRPYSVIAMVEVSDQGWDLSLEELKQSMLEQAAALGGDAVIVGMNTTQSGTALVPIGNMYFGVDQVEKQLIGKVVVYADRQQ